MVNEQWEQQKEYVESEAFRREKREPSLSKTQNRCGTSFLDA